MFDGKGATVQGKASLTILNVNDAPVARDSTANSLEDALLSGVLPATDIDGDILHYALEQGLPMVLLNQSGWYIRILAKP